MQSAETVQARFAGHFTPQVPPQLVSGSLGVQHVLLTHTWLVQSAPVVQPCASAQLLAQFPLQPGPQQRNPEQAPLWQSLLPPHAAESGHLTPELPPHNWLMSLGVQHFLSMHAKCWQSSPVVHPCPSAQRFEQFPLQAGPQQRSPEHVPLWQSPLLPQTPESGHLTPQLLPHLFVKSLGVQHFPFTHAAHFPQPSSLMHSCPTAARAVASSWKPAITATTANAIRRAGLITTADRAEVGVSIAILNAPPTTMTEFSGQTWECREGTRRPQTTCL